MDTDIFTDAFGFIVALEGGHHHDPHDPGGETKYGISKRAYPDLHIATLTLLEAQRIYKTDYWDAAAVDSIPEPYQLAVFDCAVNQGPGVARKLWADALLKGSPIAWFFTLRAMRYVGTRNFKRYGHGWMKRLFLVAIETGKVLAKGEGK